MEGEGKCRENNLGSRQTDHSSVLSLVKSKGVGVVIH